MQLQQKRIVVSMAVASDKWNAKKFTFRLFAYSNTKAANDVHTQTHIRAQSPVVFVLAACMFACGTVCERQRCIN